MSMFDGIRRMSLGSRKSEQVSSALEYARQVFHSEVYRCISLTETQSISEEFTPIKERLVEYLNANYSEEFWARVLKQVNLLDNGKKDAELFINTVATFIVSDFARAVYILYAAHTRDFTKLHKLRHLASQMDEAKQQTVQLLAENVMSIPRPDVTRFVTSYSSELNKLYNSL